MAYEAVGIVGLAKEPLTPFEARPIWVEAFKEKAENKPNPVPEDLIKMIKNGERELKDMKSWFRVEKSTGTSRACLEAKLIGLRWVRNMWPEWQ